MNIKYFENLEDLRIETGLPRIPVEKDFHAFRFIDLKDAKNYMPPYRRGFYQITLIQDFGSSTMSINDHNFKAVQDIIYFVDPRQVFSWVRDKSVKGFLVYFKSSFLDYSDEQLNQKFTFFNLYSKNLIEPKVADIEQFRAYFKNLIEEQLENKTQYRRAILKHQLSILLYRCQEIYDRYIETNEDTQENSISSIYKRHIDNLYIDVKSINEYATLMNISANYLSQTIKEQTGKTAKRILHERILLEAKNMLLYTDMTSAQIAYDLGFEEPTHFGRLFKKYEKISPLQFKKNNTI